MTAASNIAGIKKWLTTPAGRVVAIFVVLAIAGGASAAYFLNRDDLSEDAAFRHSDREITVAQLDDRLEVLEALYGVKAPEDEATADQFRRDAAKSYVVSLVLADAAAERDIVISDKEAQTELDKLIDQQLTGGRAAFVEFLSTSGISERDVLDEVRAQLATGRLIDEIAKDVPTVSEKEALATFNEYKADMVTPAGRDLINIVVASKADADRVAQIARRSGNLAPLAATWSLDGATREKQGKLGVVAQAQLEKEYGRVAFAAKKGAIFGPVRTSTGWNVGQVVDVVAAKPVAFDDVKAEIIARMTAEDRLKVWQKFLGELLEDADVEYADKYLPDDPTAPSGEVAPSGGPSEGSGAP